jgi:hypothetical protein
MNEQATFRHVGETDKAMYGARAILVCGYPVEEQVLIVDFIEQVLGKIPAVFVSTVLKNKTLGELTTLPHNSGVGDNSDLRRAVIMSGLTEQEFHRLINAYRAGKLPAQLWATMTPLSEQWTIAALLEELAKEHTEMNRMMQQRRQRTQEQINDGNSPTTP